MFKSNHVFLGTIDKGSNNHTVKWTFAEGFSKDNIEIIEPDCSCTGAILVEDGIIAGFNESEVKNWNEEATKQNKIFYPEGYVVDKKVTVFLNDGIAKNIQREDGGYYSNPLKNRIILSFSAFVKF
jgi:hypothetical protein